MFWWQYWLGSLSWPDESPRSIQCYDISAIAEDQIWKINTGRCTFMIFFCKLFNFHFGRKINEFQYIIFSSEESKDLNLFGGEAPFWTPKFVQVQELESLLLKYLKSHPPIDDRPVGNLSEYGRQYFGVTKKGRKLIYLNAFCNPSRFDQWKKRIIL